MWQNSTLQGLDDALGELRRSIDSLAEGPIKKKLVARYRQLQSVRDDLRQPSDRHRRGMHFVLFVTGIVGIGIVLYLLLRKR